MQAIATSVKEAGQALSLGRTAIYALIKEGRLDTIKVGRRRLIKIESVRLLLEQEQ